MIDLDTKGDVIRINGFARDITKSKMPELRLKESQAHYQAIIANSMSAFFLTNSKGDILEANERACSMFGYTKDELRKLSRKQILEDDDPKFIIALQHRDKTGRMKGEVAGIKKTENVFCWNLHQHNFWMQTMKKGLFHQWLILPQKNDRKKFY